MAWGLGPDNRGPTKVGKILADPGAAASITAVVTAVRQHGAAAGYKSYYANHRLPQLDVAFITKVLYFAGYKGQIRPRPIIYDSLVATTAVRLPEAPLLPSINDGVSTAAYERYCCWVEETAKAHGTDSSVVEWALFHLGREIRETVRA